ncbi:hypothetical protein JW877_03660 [bacterium]|nr:hypothetical protein [bacterium]
MINKLKNQVIILLILLLGSLPLWAEESNADQDQGPDREFARVTAAAAGAPYTQEKFHCAGDLYMTISNWGFFGSQRGDDNPYYCIADFGSHGSCEWTMGTCLPSAEYPGGSSIEYLFQGALWIGAVVEGDTLVCLGEDGWQTNFNQVFPGSDPGDSIVERSIYEDSVDAVSQQDFVCTFSDTVTNSAYTPPEHRPMGVKVTQKSYSWGYDYSKNFVFIDYIFENIRPQYFGDSITLEDMYIGIYIDGDVGHIDTDDYAQDDVTGFMRYYVDPYSGDTTEVNVAWLADNDGDPSLGRFTNKSPTGAMGCMVLQTPNPDIETSFNWWISNVDETYDWGPDQRPFEPFDGTPDGLANKYIIMSNKEFDYDQTEVVDSSTSSRWLEPPPDQGPNLQNGYDTRFLLSFGPLNVPVSDSVKVSIAFMVAEDFHFDPTNPADDPDPDKYNKTNLAYTANWCKLVFENDYQGPMPPPEPEVFYTTYDNKVTLFWLDSLYYPDGSGGTIVEHSRSEQFVDPITGLKDFEGYRVWAAEANLDRYYTMLRSWDKVNFKSRDSLGAWVDTLVKSPGTDTYRVPGSDEDSTYVREAYGYNYWPPEETTFVVGDTTKVMYKYTIHNLLAGKDMYFVVTAFDFGQVSKKLNSLESNKRNSAIRVVPKGDASTLNKVSVVPNPYRIDERYVIEEDPSREWTEYSRKIRFLNLPQKATIRIFTVDGDLVKELEHDFGEMGLDTEDWDLISRNDQAIVSGIYIYVVTDEESGESQEGKLVIIK